jgi:hypothetical protein
MQRQMNFESLANELLLDIFEYLPSVHLLQAFYNLNLRFNNLLFIHFRSFRLDFRSVSQSDLNLICREYLPAITDHIISLSLSNNDDTPQQIDLFLEHGLTMRQFDHLQSLSLYDLCSNELMNKMMLEWKYLPNLTHLTLAGCYLQFNQIHAQQLIDGIWSLPKLIYCYLNIQFGELNIFVPTVISSSLKYLFIWGIEHRQNEIKALLKQTPSLQHFSIPFNDDDDDNNDGGQSVSSITKLTLCLSQVQENRLAKFFENMSSLYHLTVDLCSLDTNDLTGILNGYQWENLIHHYLPNLQSFRFRMEFRLIEPNNRDDQTNNFINSFENSFWIEEHQWFIRCHWNSIMTSSSIYLYSLPYTFKDFSLDCFTQLKSTCPDDKDYLYYNHVNDLRYKTLPNQTFVLSPIRFGNINHLSIELPLHENFWSMIPTLDQITSLDVTIDHHDNAQSELQSLIDRIPHLSSLRFIFFRLFTLVSELRSISIRRLDLRGYTEYFNDKQCTILSRSLLGIQCEILFINIKNRNILIDLINNMIHLRTLIIRCEDDKFDEIKQDEFIIWLKDHLPAMYVISRDLVFRYDIRIWIR